MTVRVYGRTEYAEPLVELGSAIDDRDALAKFDTQWLEVIVFPEDAIHWIIRDGQVVEDE